MSVLSRSGLLERMPLLQNKSNGQGTVVNGDSNNMDEESHLVETKEVKKLVQNEVFICISNFILSVNIVIL